MKIGELINTLRRIKDKYGDLPVSGYMHEDTKLSKVCVVDSEGMEIWPHDPNKVAGQNKVDGVFFE